ARSCAQIAVTNGSRRVAGGLGRRKLVRINKALWCGWLAAAIFIFSARAATAGYVFDQAIGTQGIGNGQFENPVGVAVDTSGNVWVADAIGIEEFTSGGTFLQKFGGHGSGNGQFSSPSGVAVDSSGNVWVADYVNDSVQEFTSGGTFLQKFGTLGV